MLSALLFTLVTLTLLIPHSIQARTTPEDIVNAKKATYQAKYQRYSPAGKEKLDDYEKRIANLNKQITDDWDLNMIHQGEILDEFVRRNPNANVENARYWLTYAHEAVAYQAAKIYVFELSNEANINRDITSTISILQSDVNTLRGKVIRSQGKIQKLVTSN